jgi:WD40 repeat protein
MLARVLLALGLLSAGGPALAQQMPHELKGHTGLVYSVAFSPDGKLLATGGFDNTIKLWDWPSGKELHTLKGHTDQVYSVAFSPDGNLLASGSKDKTIRLWDPKDGKFVRELKGHGDIVDSVTFSPDGKFLASAGADKSVRLWNPADGKEVKKLGDHKGSVYRAAFSPDGKLLASCSQDTTIKLWDVAAQKEAAVLVPVAPLVVPKAKDMKKDKKDVKKETKEPKKEVKEVKKELKEPPEVPEPIMEVVFGPDSTRLFSGGFDRLLREWGMADKKQVRKWGPTEDDIFGMALSRDGKLVATAGYGGHLHVWDWASGKEVFNHHLKRVTYCVAFTPDGHALVTGHERDSVVLITPLAAQPTITPPNKK